jgi:hypothetical protein
LSRTLTRIGIEIAVAGSTLIVLLLLAAGASNNSAKAPVIIRGPNGTFTIQKPPHGGSKDSKAGSGLVIPPQVVVPLAPGIGKKP